MTLSEERTPAVLGIERQREAHRLDFMNLAAADLEDVRGLEIERRKIHRLLARGFVLVDDRDGLLGHRVAEHREAEDKALLWVGDPDAAQIDARDVAHGTRVELLGAALNANPSRWRFDAGRRRRPRRTAHTSGMHPVLAAAAVGGKRRHRSVALDH